MKRLLHTTLPLLNHLYSITFVLVIVICNRVHTRISTFRYLRNPCIIIIGKKVKILNRSTIFHNFLLAEGKNWNETNPPPHWFRETFLVGLIFRSIL